MHKTLVILGTRPEAIKLAPIIKELLKYPKDFNSFVGVTGQHDAILKQVLDLFGIQPYFNLKVMKKDQNLEDLTASILIKLGPIVKDIKPDIMLIQGDTTTTFAAALIAYYQKIRIGHVEAGLRTQDKYQPFPEEMNRHLTDQMSDLLFAPTEINRSNLIKSGIPDQKIYVTGNTIVDALLDIASTEYTPKTDCLSSIKKNMILVTAHRRESFGKPLQNIFHAIKKLADMYPEFQFICPVHPNPNIRGIAYKIMNGLKNINLIEPLDYLAFVYLMKKSFLILSDSGGIQEEAPSLNKPLLILRNKTERPEVITAGGAKLVGTDPERIISETRRLFEDKEAYNKMANIENPYGDGTASQKIVQVLQKQL